MALRKQMHHKSGGKAELRFGFHACGFRWLSQEGDGKAEGDSDCRNQQRRVEASNEFFFVGDERTEESDAEDAAGLT